MRSFLAFLFSLIVGTAGGLAMTYFAATKPHGFGRQQAGTWQAWPLAGTADAEPYGRAVQARSGYIPLGAAEGVALFAEQDASGRALGGGCRYHVAGRTPTARYWTLEAFTPKGLPMPGVLGRSGFTSAEVLRDEDGRFDVVVSREAEPGNWLQIDTSRPFVLVLRFYDTVLSASAFALDPQLLPQISREDCP